MGNFAAVCGVNARLNSGMKRNCALYNAAKSRCFGKFQPQWITPGAEDHCWPSPVWNYFDAKNNRYVQGKKGIPCTCGRSHRRGVPTLQVIQCCQIQHVCSFINPWSSKNVFGYYVTESCSEALYK